MRLLLPTEVTKEGVVPAIQRVNQSPQGTVVEIECRTRQCSATQFYTALKILQSAPDCQTFHFPAEVVEYYNNKIRARRCGDHFECGSKKTVWKSGDLDMDPIRLAFSVALERAFNEIPPEAGHPVTVLQRDHWRFALLSYPGIVIDMYRWHDRQDLKLSRFQMEVDLSFDSTVCVDLSTRWWTPLKYVLGNIFCPDSFFVGMRSFLQAQTPYLLNMVSRSLSIESFPSSAAPRPKSVPNFESLVRKDQQNYHVSVKLDGENEVFLVGFPSGALLLVVNHVSPVEIRWLKVEEVGRSPFPSFVLQAEWMRSQQAIHVFDALLVDGKSVLNLPHTERLQQCAGQWDRIVQVVAEAQPTLKMYCKEWQPTIENLSAWSQSLPNDGYIWMPKNQTYFHGDIFKQKPTKCLTIDVEVVRQDNGSFFCLAAKEQPNKNRRVLLERQAVLDIWENESVLRRHSVEAGLPETYWEDCISESKSSKVECELVVSEKGAVLPVNTLLGHRLVPYRYRPSKNRANSLWVVLQTLQMATSHVHTITISRSSTDIRADHNMVKRILIENHISTAGARTVLDIGYGKGGDQWKYKRISPPVLDIYASEPDLSHWEEAKSRMKELHGKPNIHPVQIGVACQDLDLNKLNNQLRSAVKPLSMALFFSFAYLWKQESYLMHWFKVLEISDASTLVLTFLDQYELRTQLAGHPRLVIWRKEDSSWQDIQFNADQFYESIDRGQSVFGHEVKVSVFPSETAKQVTEWVVHQPTLLRLMQAKGWTLTKTGLFSQLVTANDPWNRLFRWQVWARDTKQ